MPGKRGATRRLGRGCSHIHPGGRPCGATPMKDVPFCFWHAPGNEDVAAEARRLGGLRRKREKTLGAPSISKAWRRSRQSGRSSRWRRSMPSAWRTRSPEVDTFPFPRPPIRCDRTAGSVVLIGRSIGRARQVTTIRSTVIAGQLSRQSVAPGLARSTRRLSA
jgi:hypothetical protein